MADPWVFLLSGGALVLLGFAAAQVFDRFRFPDYFILIAVGLVIGSVAIPYAIDVGMIPAADDPRASLRTVAPILTSVALAFILFEGGLVVHVRGLGKVWRGAGAHTLVAMALSVAGVVLAGTVLLGLSLATSLVMALAFCGPSASIDISMLSQLRASERTKFTIIVEGVMGNIVAAVFVLLFIQLSGLSTEQSTILTYLVFLALSVAVAWLAGEAWARVIGGRSRRFAYMTSVAVAVILYAVSEGLLGGNGGITAFVFGLVLGHRQLASPRPDVAASRGLQDFHRELVFLLRTFFFVYLGIRVTLTGLSLLAVLGAIAFIAVFVASRWPSTAVLGRAWRLHALDTRILRATVARGMTDTVLILFAIEAGYIPAAEAQLATNLLFLVILGAALTAAVLVFRAERIGVRPAAPAAVPEAPPPAPPPSVPPDLERALSEFLEDPVVVHGEID